MTPLRSAVTRVAGVLTGNLGRPSALALMAVGWPGLLGAYEITNYAGTIGEADVHLSLQDMRGSNDAGSATHFGSYYYDKYSSPIALVGMDDGRTLRLCESENARDVIVTPHSAPSCPFKLAKNGDSLVGTWNGANDSLTVRLDVSGVFDSDADPIVAVGNTSIPVWDQNDRFAFLIRYGKDRVGAGQHRPVVKSIDVIDKARGQVIQRIDSAEIACEYFGFVSSVAYMHLEVSKSSNEVSTLCGSGLLRFRYSADGRGSFRFNRVK